MVIQMARQPDGSSARSTGQRSAGGPACCKRCRHLAGSTYARAIDVTQAQANNYLQSSIVPDQEGAAKLLRANFSRAFVMIRSGELDFFVEQILYRWPIYMRLTTVPEHREAR